MKHIEFRLLTAKKVVSSGPDWFHEVKYDGNRLSSENAALAQLWRTTGAASRART
jgi:hypothetical protein